MLPEMNDENLNIESVVEKAPENLSTAEGAFYENRSVLPADKDARGAGEVKGRTVKRKSSYKTGRSP